MTPPGETPELPRWDAIAAFEAETTPKVPDEQTAANTENANLEQARELQGLKPTGHLAYLNERLFVQLSGERDRILAERDVVVLRADAKHDALNVQIAELLEIRREYDRLIQSRKFWRWIGGVCTFAMAIGGACLGAYSYIDTRGYATVSTSMFSIGWALVALGAIVELGIVFRNV